MLIKAKKVDLHTCVFVSLSEHFYLYLIKYGYHSCSLVRIVYDKFLMFSQGIQRIFIARMMRYWCSMQQRYHHYQPRHIHVRFYSTCKIILWYGVIKIHCQLTGLINFCSYSFYSLAVSATIYADPNAKVTFSGEAH